MVVDSREAISEVQIGAKEASGSRPLSKSQINFNAKEKSTKIHEVSMERVQDSPPRSQSKGVPSKVVKLVIEPPRDPIE
jgi:hypothetical protein